MIDRAGDVTGSKQGFSLVKLILANPRGFCAGVGMAIEVVDRVLGLFPDRTVYVYHEIVHNRHVVGRFRGRGVVFVEDVAEVPEGEVVVFSAHGIPPSVHEAADARGLISIDATCPLVTKVHSEAIRYARQGFQILLIGHADHQEVIGTRGEAPDATQVVESPECIASLDIKDPDKLIYLTQTTLSTDDAAVIIDALRAAFPNIKAPPSEDICYATTNRQHAVRSLAPECDVVLVVGSTNSSNSKRLTEIAENVGSMSYLLDDASDLRDDWFPTGNETVLVTAGASAPEDLVAELCRVLVVRYGATIEQRDVFSEDVEFALPGALRKILSDLGDPRANEPVRMGGAVITKDRYGAVPLTISANE